MSGYYQMTLDDIANDTEKSLWKYSETTAFYGFIHKIRT